MLQIVPSQIDAECKQLNVINLSTQYICAKFIPSGTCPILIQPDIQLIQPNESLMLYPITKSQQNANDSTDSQFQTFNGIKLTYASFQSPPTDLKRALFQSKSLNQLLKISIPLVASPIQHEALPVSNVPPTKKKLQSATIDISNDVINFFQNQRRETEPSKFVDKKKKSLLVEVEDKLLTRFSTDMVKAPTSIHMDTFPDDSVLDTAKFLKNDSKKQFTKQQNADNNSVQHIEPQKHSEHAQNPLKIQQQIIDMSLGSFHSADIKTNYETNTELKNLSTVKENASAHNENNNHRRQRSIFDEQAEVNMDMGRMISSTVHKAKLKSASLDMIKTGINDLLLQKVTKLKEDQQLEKAQATFAKIQQSRKEMEKEVDKQYQIQKRKILDTVIVMVVFMLVKMMHA
ncbi:Hypothetical_protein [Hexamita inflata]|uniref:Hypothetical_protein n=1 Tax=Hexamita inflata TaxID=28002 RepID=A0AA86P2C8_9EUKA|nr:Hypothetical protein HINF_LOCUS17393 [Hexamita inflata]